MASKVGYKQGTKKTYLGLEKKSNNNLYFCTDTKELFKGDDLYSDGIRLINTKSSLPSFDTAADGIIYLCEDTGAGYVLNSARNGWIQAISNGDVSERMRFATLSEAEEWAKANSCAGFIFSVHNGSEWLPYIVQNDNSLKPFKDSESINNIKRIDGGTSVGN